MKKLPKKVLVMIIGGGTSDEYLRAEIAPEDFDTDEEGLVGVYELKEIKSKKTRIELL